jgi:hypothetical protein
MKYILIIAVLGMMVLGCAQSSPVVPGETSIPDLSAAQSGAIDEGPYRLWGEYDLYISADHERVEAVPKRTARFHLNALKFLEETCGNCLQILSVRNNYDGTIDLTIRITHPFNGFPQYTGFDVKGIIMFDGSIENPIAIGDETNIPVEGSFFRISWKDYGDPEILNPDGYTFRWNPEWDEGSSRPILNYWPGRFSNGTPTAHINAYLNFYSHEERHMFAHDQSVTRTYHIWLPPEPIIAGYAVEACWEPPTVMPVTDPLTDFPISANQPEPYVFNVVLNEGNVITDCHACCDDENCEQLKFQSIQWEGPASNRFSILNPAPWEGGSGGDGVAPCDMGDDWYSSWIDLQPTCAWGNGEKIGLAYALHFASGGHKSRYAYTIYRFVNDDPSLD